MATTNTKLEAKLDQLTDIVVGIDKKMTQIETTMCEREKTTKLINENIEKAISNTNERVDNLEDNQKWLVRSIIGSVITAIMGIILNIVK